MDQYTPSTSKRVKLGNTEFCTVCHNPAVKNCDIDYENREIYAKLLLKYLVPTPPRGWWDIEDVQRKLYFCDICTTILKELWELTESFSKLAKSIEAKVEWLKIAILKSGDPPVQDVHIDTLRGIAVKEFKPVVRLELEKASTLLQKWSTIKDFQNKAELISISTDNEEKDLRQRHTQSQVEHHQSYGKGMQHLKVSTESRAKFVPENYPAVIENCEISGVKEENEVETQNCADDDPLGSEVIISVAADLEDYTFVEEVVKFEPWGESSENFNDIQNYPFDDANDDVTNYNKSTDEVIFQVEKEPNIAIVDHNMLTPRNQVTEIKFWPKPTLSMTQFAILAIKNGPPCGLFVHDIMKFISDNFPYYQTAKNWKFLLREALTCNNSCFVRNAEDRGTITGSLSGRWTANDEKITENFKMRIVNVCDKAFVAFPEKLEDMLQALMSVNSNGNTSSLSKDPHPIPLAQPFEMYQYTSPTSNEQSNIIFEKSNEFESENVNQEQLVNLNEQEQQHNRENENYEEHSLIPVNFVPFNAERNWNKPSLDIPELTILAMANIGKPATSAEVYDFVAKNFPYYFKNAVSNNCKQINSVLTTGYQYKHVGVSGSKHRLWTIDMARIKDRVTPIAEMLENSLESVAYPDKWRRMLKPLFHDVLSYNHLIFVTLVNFPRNRAVQKTEIIQSIRNHFWPFCKKDESVHSKITDILMDRLKNDNLCQNCGNGVVKILPDFSCANIRKELKYILFTSPDTILNSMTNPEMVEVLFKNAVEDFDFSSLHTRAAQRDTSHFTLDLSQDYSIDYTINFATGGLGYLP